MRWTLLALLALPLATLNCSCASTHELQRPSAMVSGSEHGSQWRKELGFRPWQARSLGAAQDAGMPHLGCEKTNCATARRDGIHANVAALAISNDDAWFLVDATPDLPAQIHSIGTMPAGILLTHAHIGHYSGLMFLGREGMNADHMPVHCSRPMAEFLSANAPWSQLVELGNIELRPFEPSDYGVEVPVALDPELVVRAIRVPHRDEFADTHGFSFRAVEGVRTVLYIPDIDRWDAVTFLPEPRAHLSMVIDGSFWDDGELGDRDMSGIPHPRVRASMERFEAAMKATGGEVVFTHLNHTNPLWMWNSTATSELRDRGFQCTWPYGWSTNLLPPAEDHGVTASVAAANAHAAAKD